MTSEPWRVTKLVEILKPIQRREAVDPFKEYRLLGVRLDGHGAFHRETRIGSEIAARYLSKVRTGDFIYSRLFAWRGAFGVISPALDGGYVSGEFPTFTAVEERVDVEFLRLWFRLATILSRVESMCTGSTPLTRNRFKENFLLNMDIDLPPLWKQQRIVARIKQMTGKIDEMQHSRTTALEAANSLLQSALHEFFVIRSNGWDKMPMTQAIVINDRQVNPTLPEYSSLPHLNGENIESETCRLLPFRSAEEDGVKSNKYLFHPNTVLYSKIRPYLRKAVYVDFQGLCSADIYPIKVINEKLEPKFVMWSLIADPFTQHANSLSGRTRMPKLNRKQLFSFTLTYPPRNEQSRLVSYLENLQTKAQALKKWQVETAKEIERLLPCVLDRALT